MSQGSVHEWGRVDADGNVFVRTADGERSVGQYPAGTPEEALAFFTERFEALSFEVELLVQRIRSGVMSPEESLESVKTVSAQVEGANAVGDLASLSNRLEELRPVIDEQREARKAERVQKAAEAKDAKELLVAEAEKIAEGSDWRAGANRLRTLLDQWKALPRIDRASDDALWHRFSGARTSYTRRRKVHFAEQSEKREAARTVKERLVKEAESLADSTEWGPTAGRYRDLMRQWKAAGPAPKDVDDELWRRFRGAQDTFFGARDATNAALDAEYAANAEVKEKLLVEAEALLPVTDLDSAKRALRVPGREVGGRRQGPPRTDQGARGPDARGRTGGAVRRGRAVAPLRPREVRPRGRHGRPARERHRPGRGRPRQGAGGRQREAGQGARGEPRLPAVLPRHGPPGLRRLLRLKSQSPPTRRY